jgi:hypothetical protein
MAEPFVVPCDVDRIAVNLDAVVSRAYPPPVFVAVTALVLLLLEKDPVAAYAATGAMTVPAANAATGRTNLRTRGDSLKPIIGTPGFAGTRMVPKITREFEHRPPRAHNGDSRFSRARHQKRTSGSPNVHRVAVIHRAGSGVDP